MNVLVPIPVYPGMNIGGKLVKRIKRNHTVTNHVPNIMYRFII